MPRQAESCLSSRSLAVRSSRLLSAGRYRELQAEPGSLGNSVRSTNGAQLAGLWGPAEGDAVATLVLADPMGKAANGFWLRYGHANLFRTSGFNVLAFDANGFGESKAVSFDYPADILAAGLFAQPRQPALGVGLVGASFGAG